MATPRAKKGARVTAVRRIGVWPFHHSTSNRAVGRVQVTVLLSRAAAKRNKAAQYKRGLRASS